jgi:hypothetical protein
MPGSSTTPNSGEPSFRGGTELKVAVVDFNHYEVVEAFVRVLQPLGIELSLVVSDWIASDLKQTNVAEAPNISTYIASSDNRPEIIREILSDQSIDVCIFSTLDSDFAEYRNILSLFRGTKLLVVHNLSYWFSKRRIAGLFSVPRHPLHRILLDSVAQSDAIIVLSGELKLHALRHYRIRRPIVEFTTCIARERFDETVEVDKPPRIVIPGQIEAKRRDYHAALDSFEQLEKDSAELVLLGAPFDRYGASVTQRCKVLSDQGWKICWYERYVPQTEFDSQMNRASVVLSPIVPTTNFSGVVEHYGTSKITGAIPDMIRYGKPGILPSYIQFPPELVSSVRTYHSQEELTTILKSFGNAEERKRITGNAKKNSRHWELPQVRARFISELETIGIHLADTVR